MNCLKNANNDTIFTNDLLFETFVDNLIQGWGKSIPADKPITMEDFQEWLNKFNAALQTSAEDYFRRFEIVKKNLEVSKNESMS